MKRNVVVTSSLLIVFLFLITLSAMAEEWYKGGSLHKATVKMWREATYDNRLATSGDWFNEITKIHNPELQKKFDNIYEKLGYDAWLLAIKEFAEQLEKCVSDIAMDERLCKPEDLAAEIASMCYITMYLSEGE